MWMNWPLIIQITKDYPEELRSDIALHLYRELLYLPLFSGAPQGCLKRLAYQSVRNRFFTPGEFLLHSDDRISSLYFVCSGSLEILRDGLVVAILGMLYLIISCYINHVFHYLITFLYLLAIYLICGIFSGPRFLNYLYLEKKIIVTQILRGERAV